MAANSAIWEQSLRVERAARDGHHAHRGRPHRRPRRPGRHVPGQRGRLPGATSCRAAQVRQITADHSLAEERVRHGEMTEAEAEVHPHRHILTRALGVGPDVDVDLWELHVETGDRSCSCAATG